MESSTVSPVQEMVNMIHTFRAYETNQRMITLQDQIMGRVANDVGRLA
ncbi:MAG: flagellar basal body rod C-terminal domain-containing protein [Planctomycetota bacterium]